MPGHSSLLVALDLTGVFVFALSGGLLGVRKRLDVFGVLVLAVTTGLGGGFLRDVLIGATPPAALRDWRYLLVPVVAGLLVFAFHPLLGRMERFVNVFDAAGLGLFCVTGAIKAMSFGLGPVPSALMGLVTGIGGGMVRDLLAGRVPIVFSSELYATPALAGAIWAVLTRQAGWSDWLVSVPGVLLCFGWRVLALVRNWRSPLPRGPASV
ncbi:MAG TPA: trimeric intracellular cation channel family protein [Marmoricola sp.]|nr:trimeric intracellular cation channel family protein [Marmoricola sp.]